MCYIAHSYSLWRWVYAWETVWVLKWPSGYFQYLCCRLDATETITTAMFPFYCYIFFFFGTKRRHFWIWKKKKKKFKYVITASEWRKNVSEKNKQNHHQHQYNNLMTTGTSIKISKEKPHLYKSHRFYCFLKNAIPSFFNVIISTIAVYHGWCW